MKPEALELAAVFEGAIWTFYFSDHRSANNDGIAARNHDREQSSLVFRESRVTDETDSAFADLDGLRELVMTIAKNADRPRKNAARTSSHFDVFARCARTHTRLIGLEP